jgi:hypothetical protein
MKNTKVLSLKVKTSCTTNNLSNQFTHTTLYVYVLSIILLISLLCISN